MPNKKRECQPAEKDKKQKEILRLQLENRDIQNNLDILKRNYRDNKKEIDVKSKELKSCK